MRQDYKNYEIIIVNDGSTDKTHRVAKAIKTEHPERIKYFKKQNGGKARALNYGIARSSGEIVVSMDADSIFQRNTVRKLVLSFYDKDVVAVGGNVKVANRDNFLTKHETVEYITGLNIQRRSFAMLGCMQVISGAIGAFRKDSLLAAGGYSADTIVEDMDITISLQTNGGKVVYNGNAIAFTEAPDSISNFLKQRYRWTFGGFQVLRKHRYMLFNPSYKNLGMIGLPYFMIFPWLDVSITCIFGIALFSVIMFGHFIDLLIFYFLMCLVQGVLISYSLRIDGEDKKLALVAGIDSLWYNHMISFVTVKAGFNYLRKVEAGWNKFERLGKNYLPIAR